MNNDIIILGQNSVHKAFIQDKDKIFSKIIHMDFYLTVVITVIVVFIIIIELLNCTDFIKLYKMTKLRFNTEQQVTSPLETLLDHVL